jgi:hypothetical protein
MFFPGTPFEPPRAQIVHISAINIPSSVSGSFSLQAQQGSTFLQFGASVRLF